MTDTSNIPNIEDLIVFNGINGSTGEYLFPHLTVDALAKIAEGKTLTQDELDYIMAIYEKISNPDFAVAANNGDDFKKSGWGFVTAPDMKNRDAILEALEPLISLRKKQVEESVCFRQLSFIDGEDDLPVDWLANNEAAPGTVDCKNNNMPYYLLLIGSPQDIPLDFQFTLDVEYAVGRIYFETVEEYAEYAKQVVERETQNVTHRREAMLFGVKNDLDLATNQSIKYLIDPLHKTLTEKHTNGDTPWKINIEKGQATKARFSEILHQETPPSLLLSASHGMGFNLGDPRQKNDQGALLCSDWPGAAWGENKPIPKDFYFAADDIASGTNLQGMMVFPFACYGGATPMYDSFQYEATHDTQKQIAPKDFISALPQRLLTAGASAVIAHYDRAWSSSFIGKFKVDNTATFKGIIDELFAGIPVGHAMRHINDYYSHMESNMTLIQTKMKRKPDYKISSIKLGNTYISRTDARNYILFGDPATRLNIA